MGTGPTNPETRALIINLNRAARKEKVALWKRIAEELSRPTRQRREINIFKINQYANSGETALIPGKVLGDGELTKDIKVAALSFSQSARAKIKSPLSIGELLAKNPKGKNVRIIG